MLLRERGPIVIYIVAHCLTLLKERSDRHFSVVRRSAAARHNGVKTEQRGISHTYIYQYATAPCAMPPRRTMGQSNQECKETTGEKGQTFRK